MTLQNIKLERLSSEEFQAERLLGERAAVVGEEEDAAFFWRAAIKGSGGTCVILISHPDYHLEPGVYRLGAEAALVGVLDQLYLLENCGVARAVTLPCRFYEIIYSDEDRFVVQHEIGFTCFSYDLGVFWEWTGDLVSRWQIEAGELAFETFEGDQQRLAINPSKSPLVHPPPPADEGGSG